MPENSLMDLQWFIKHDGGFCKYFSAFQMSSSLSEKLYLMS